MLNISKYYIFYSAIHVTFICFPNNLHLWNSWKQLILDSSKYSANRWYSPHRKWQTPYSSATFVVATNIQLYVHECWLYTYTNFSYLCSGHAREGVYWTALRTCYFFYIWVVLKSALMFYIVTAEVMLLLFISWCIFWLLFIL
jgi:hypothetical protein